MKIRNFNSHPVKILPADYVNFTIPVPNAEVAELLSRCAVYKSEGKPKIQISRTPSKQKSGNIKINESNIGKIDGLPPEEEDVMIIVPSIIYIALHRIRKDIYVIDEPIRSETGVIIACRSLARPRYSLEDNQIKAVAKKFDACYSRILRALGQSKTYEDLRKNIVIEEQELSEAVVALTNLTK